MYTGDDGETHYAEHTLTGRIDATGVSFVDRPESAGPSDWHNPSERQLIIRVAGDIEMETSDGDKRRLGPGSVVLAEDFEGKGHRITQVWGDGVVVFVKLPVEG